MMYAMVDNMISNWTKLFLYCLDLELKSIVSRHEKNTVPPLQLRVGSKLERKFDKELKEMLLKVSLQDPTLFEEKPEAEKCDFMAELGMKTAETSEKTSEFFN